MYNKTIIYNDCNNNAKFLIKLFETFYSYLEFDLSWNISYIELIPVYKGDSLTGEIDLEIQEVLNFQKNTLKYHTVNILNSDLIYLLKNIKTIYYGNFECINNNYNKININIFDGDIIEIKSNLSFIKDLNLL